MAPPTTTLGDIYERCYRNVMSSMREEQDTLLGSVGENATSIQIRGTVGNIDTSAILEIDEELFLVQGVNGTNNPVIDVIPAYYDSVTGSHSAGTIVTVNPRFPRVEMYNMANETLADLCNPTNGLFQGKSLMLTYQPVYVGYDFYDPTLYDPITSEDANPDPAQVLDIREVRVHEYGPFNKWPVVPLSNIRLNRNADPGSFPLSAGVSSNGYGMAVEFMGGGYPGRPIRCLYSYPYQPFPSTDPSNTVAATGIDPYAGQELILLGVTYRMFNYRGLKRSFTETQWEPRKAQEVPVGASATESKNIMMLYTQRIASERSRLDLIFKQRWR